MIIKLRRNPTSEISYMYGFKMAMFDNGNIDEFLLFVQHFNIHIEASGTLAANGNIQYLRTLLCG